MPTRPAEPQFPRQTAADRTLQYVPSVIDQVVSDMRGAVVGTQLLCSSLRENNGFACHRQLTARTAPRHVFDDMPIPVAGGKILVGVHSRSGLHAMSVRRH